MEYLTKQAFILLLLFVGVILVVAGLTTNKIGRFKGWFVLVFGVCLIAAAIYLD